MVNFGPRETVPPQFEGRNLYVHNPTITLMRTTPDECAELGRTIGRMHAIGAPVYTDPIKALRECGFHWMLVQEHTVETIEGRGLMVPAGMAARASRPHPPGPRVATALADRGPDRRAEEPGEQCAQQRLHAAEGAGRSGRARREGADDGPERPQPPPR